MRQLSLIAMVLVLCAWTHGTPSVNPANGYTAEDGTTYYTSEDGVTFYVQES